MKVNWITIVFGNNQTVRLDDVTTLTISNTGKFDIQFVNHGQSRTLVALLDPPASFTIESPGNLMSLEFDVICPVGSEVTLDYCQVKKC